MAILIWRSRRSMASAQTKLNKVITSRHPTGNLFATSFPRAFPGRAASNCNMTLTEAEKRHAQLVEEIRRHDHAYYILAQPTISDHEYDRLYHEVLDLEKAFPALVTPDSPSQRVGGQPLKGF